MSDHFSYWPGRVAGSYREEYQTWGAAPDETDERTGTSLPIVSRGCRQVFPMPILRHC